MFVNWIGKRVRISSLKKAVKETDRETNTAKDINTGAYSFLPGKKKK